METQQVTIPSLNNMLLGIIAEQSTEIHKIRGLGDRRRNGLSTGPQWSAWRRCQIVEQTPGQAIAESDNGLS